MKRLALACLLSFSAPVLAQHVPPCLPSLKGIGAWHLSLGLVKVSSTVSTRADSYIVWLCSLSTGYDVEAWIFPPSSVAADVSAYIEGQLSLSQVQAACTANCWTLTASEQTYVNGLLAQYKVVATVGASGAATTRQIYNASLQPITGATVAVGASCNPGLHIPSHPLPLGTDPYPLYDVGGQPNALTGAILPAGSYASCNVKLPSIGVGNL